MLSVLIGKLLSRKRKEKYFINETKKNKEENVIINNL